ncbi:MAG: Tn3 family transposase [Methylococcales bacterium]|nr:Tn3 family transposase [Methylococcales bacterium]
MDCLPLGTFFPERKYISMLEMLATVDQTTNFLDEFEHWQIKYQKNRPAKKILFAGIIGYGCDIGHRKLAQISKQIDDADLDNAVNWYCSLQNVQGTNNRILRLSDSMNLPNIYRRQSDVLHTSSDGRKADVAVDSLNANYSFKYLGKDKGVSAITFIDMHDLMWHSTVISSAEREAPYVIDGLMHNDVIKSDIHLTDTPGYSEIIFALTYLLLFEYARRIKGLGRQQLSVFKHRKHYEELGYLSLPDRTIREPYIEDQWDDVLRFIATIRLKVTTASQLFKRLNSYSKQHPLYRALKEFGKNPKTLFILKYSDDLEFRQAIEKQLNEVESSNKSSRAVSFGHSQEFIQSEKEDQVIAEACRRLIKNAIVCWDYLYLSRELATEKNEERKAELIEAIRNGSVFTWKHFNLHGEFDFSDERMVDSMGLAVPKNLDWKPD